MDIDEGSFRLGQVLHLMLDKMDKIIVSQGKLESSINEVMSTIVKISHKVEKMAGELDALTAQVTKNTEVIDSAITLIKGIKQKLDEAIASGNPAALKALSDTLGAKDQELADAVVANTPAA